MTENKSKDAKTAKSAVALKHNEGDNKNAPQVVAKGLADEIIALAKQSGVLIHEDPYLSEFLASLDLGQEIPEELYHVIAELISFSYVLQGKFPESWAKDYNKVSKKV